MARNPISIVALGFALLLLLSAAIVLSLAIGAKSIPFAEVVNILTGQPDVDPVNQAVVLARIPRTAIGIAVGAAMGVSGTLMQGATRNDLADPGLLGVNAGATFAIVVGGGIGLVNEGLSTLVLAMLGAGATTLAVQAIASVGSGGPTPMKTILAGAALNAGLYAFSQATLLIDQAALDRLRFWQVGSIATTTFGPFWQIIPAIALGLVLSLIVPSSLNALAMGDDVARGLGVHIPRARALAIAATTLLCGAAVSLAGPIGFLGLMIPHILRTLVGPDYRMLVPLAMISAPVITLVIDVIGRVAQPPGEVEVGVGTALFGAPVFVLLVRTRLKGAQ